MNEKADGAKGREQAIDTVGGGAVEDVQVSVEFNLIFFTLVAERALHINYIYFIISPFLVLKCAMYPT